MQSSEIRERYLKFFEKRGHTIIPSASLVPENDPSSLFTTAGMQPLVPYLLGEKHPGGTRLVDVQKCIRTGDIEDVGDNRHLTFFEMLGNWSLGDYFKKEAIEWSLEFLTSKSEGLGLDPKRLYITVFKGEDGIPRDEDAIKFWKENFSKHNITAEVSNDEIIKDNIRIIPLGKDDNFWIAGNTGPCGGDTEMFYDVVGEEKGGKVEGKFHDLVKAGRIIEIWNNVFMEFYKQLKPEKYNEVADYTLRGKKIPEDFYSYRKLPSQNVDTGMGLERTTVVMQGKTTVFNTDIFEPIISKIREFAKKRDDRAERIIADHIRAAVFMISDGVIPSNTERGYVLRRLLRRAIRYADSINMQNNSLYGLAFAIIVWNEKAYPNLKVLETRILEVIKDEEIKFRKTLSSGIKEVEKTKEKLTPPISSLPKLVFDLIREHYFFKPINPGESIPMYTRITGRDLFNLYTTSGFPIEMIIEELEKSQQNFFGKLLHNYIYNKEKILKEFEEEMKKHQEISKAGSEQKFKGGLASHGEMETKYHTATHMLLASLQHVLKSPIVQKGSNITAERLRFDFNWPTKLTPEQVKAVEDMVNEKIKEALPVTMQEMPKAEAQKIATTLAFDLANYGDIVKVYKIGVKNGEYFSIEFCGGPHVKNTSELGHFKIVKEEAVSAGVRRIKAVLE